MARKTFGRDGRAIKLADGEVEPITITEHTDDGDSAGEVATAVVETGEPEYTVTRAVGETASENNGTGNTAGEGASDAPTIKPKRKYTRRNTADTATTTKKNSAQFITANLEKVLFNLHTMGAGLLAEPELAISEDEAKLLANAVEQVAQAYNLTTVLSPKAQASVDLGIALITVYGVRGWNLYNKQKKHVPHVVTMPVQRVQDQPSPVQQQNPPNSVQ